MFACVLYLRSIKVMNGHLSKVVELHDRLADLKAEFDSCRKSPPAELL